MTRSAVGRRKLRVTGLTKRFGDRAVLDDISITVPRGQVVVILGPSGSGKTTLLRSINGLELPESGVVELDGVRVDHGGPAAGREAALRAIRTRTAMVFQSFNLFPHRNVLDNVIEGLRHVRREPPDSARARGLELLVRMGLAGRAADYPARLSGGQRQRVAIARGLAMDPLLMLFDEPTSALDPALRSEVLAVMRELAASGMTMLVVTHEMQFARDVADRILFFRDGHIVADGAPADLFADKTATEFRAFVGAAH